MKKIFTLLFNQQLESFKLVIPLLKVLFDALLLWSLNLVIPFCFIILSPILVKNLSDIPMFNIELVRFWLVEGFRFHIVLYVVCLLIVLEEKLNEQL